MWSALANEMLANMTWVGKHKVFACLGVPSCATAFTMLKTEPGSSLMQGRWKVGMWSKPGSTLQPEATLAGLNEPTTADWYAHQWEYRFEDTELGMFCYTVGVTKMMQSPTAGINIPNSLLPKILLSLPVEIQTKR